MPLTNKVSSSSSSHIFFVFLFETNVSRTAYYLAYTQVEIKSSVLICSVRFGSATGKWRVTIFLAFPCTFNIALLYSANSYVLSWLFDVLVVLTREGIMVNIRATTGVSFEVSFVVIVWTDVNI